MPDPYHPYQQYQNQYQDPSFGQSHDEGTIEEHIHRSVNKRLDRSRSPAREIFGKQPRTPLIVGAAGILLAAVTLAMFLVWKGSADTRMSQMQNQITSMAQQLQTAQETANVQSANYAGLSGKVNNLGAAMGTWNLTCAQALESQNGPGTYYFPCSSVRP